jgi:membrane protease YdiL (CAAX protease family)
MVYAAIVGDNANAAVGQAFSGISASWPWALTVLVCVAFIVPICEEILYRGLLWGALEQRWGKVIAATVSTVVFAAAHFELYRAPLLLIVAIPIALARYFANGLLASIVAHQANNLLPGVVLMFGLMGMMPGS